MARGAEHPPRSCTWELTWDQWLWKVEGFPRSPRQSLLGSPPRRRLQPGPPPQKGRQTPALLGREGSPLGQLPEADKVPQGVAEPRGPGVS